MTQLYHAAGVGSRAGEGRGVRGSGECFGLASTYSAFPLIVEERARVIRGELDAIRLVQVEYLQGWLTAEIDADATAAAKWTVIDPGRAGASRG